MWENSHQLTIAYPMKPRRMPEGFSLPWLLELLSKGAEPVAVLSLAWNWILYRDSRLKAEALLSAKAELAQELRDQLERERDGTKVLRELVTVFRPYAPNHTGPGNRRGPGGHEPE